MHERRADDERTLVALNLGAAAATVSLAGGEQGTVLLSVRLGRADERVSGAFDIAPGDGLVIEL